jgi:glucuronoarabinoxylan endo-1,4-beta-xylanase
VGEASAWLWWWYRALGDTNEGLLLADGTVAKRQWTLGNYSKFIRPGYTRVDIAGAIPEGIEPTAFVGADGTVVVVVVNHNTSAVELPISINGGTIPSSVTPNVTSATDDLAEKAALTVTNGTFTASLGATSVTTFVGR